MKRVLWLLAVVFVALLVSSSAQATELVLTGDTHVSTARPTTNFGTLANLYVGNGNTALLQFDLGTLPGGTTASQVASATLTVFVNRVNSGGTVYLSPVTSAWTELSATSNSSPGLGASTANVHRHERRRLHDLRCDLAGAGLDHDPSQQLRPRAQLHRGQPAARQQGE